MRASVPRLLLAGVILLSASCTEAEPAPELPTATYDGALIGITHTYENVSLKQKDGDVCATCKEGGKTILLAFHPETRVETRPLRVVLPDGQEFEDGGSFTGSPAPTLDGGLDCGGHHFDNVGILVQPGR